MTPSHTPTKPTTHSILDKIGNTPLVPIKRLNPLKKVAIYAKLEAFNPGGSVKDRVALNMIETAEAEGELTPDKIVLEATSGNTGIGLAMVCAVKGYKCQLIMPESASIERRKIMEAFGAEILLTPGKRGTDGAIEQAYALARQYPDRYFLTDQFNNTANWLTHYKTTGPEIWEQTGGRVTDIVATLGTSGTVMGLCRYFSEHHPEVRVTAVEPFLGHKLQGLKNMKESYTPGIFDKKLPFQIINIPDEEAFTSVRLLARKEGIFAGMSSGAAMSAALTRAAQLKEGVLVAIFPDGGEKYLSTELFTKQETEESQQAELRFFNTLSRKKEVFRPIVPDTVTFYACGPTAHELAHLAHCRRFMVADLVHRVLVLKGYQVKFYMNFTDLDDNTIRGAGNNKESLAAFTGRYIQDFKQDMAALEMLEAAGYPRASEHVPGMIALAQKLVDKGYAYEKHGSIYFDISKFAKYGRLSGVDLSKIQVGKTVDLDDYEKENPVDFTLLKRSTLSELKSGIFFQTEWGNMRPGWHIECAAMTLDLLGETMDIHTSGRDLLFPHHENENAIAEALTGKPLANFWLHSELLLVDGKKMSAENRNLITLRDVLDKGYTGREMRYFLIRTHYRKPINFSFRSLDAASKNLRRLDAFVGKLLCLPPGLPHAEVAAYLSDMEDRFFKALNDDLNVSKAFAALFDFIKKTNPILSQGLLDREQKDYILEALRRINSVLGIMRLEECPLAPEIDKLIRDREEARKRKDWQKADGVRQELAKKGIEVVDTAKGPVWKEVEKQE
ncbi:MAG: cysteine--tRNA ligase [Proteobacteria bacterium]|nr:cysteine--tRNA ligase [Pseudomonadota bacterium]MBU1547773.1 cysteine--tRNA ligase [Pseudomonadota bacterium]MBU2619691.1 cysteine--tRNA ligase [Pseudomonadota bacterium]